MGTCTVRCADGQVSLTGHRMPVPLVWLRSFGYVVFVPWFFALFAAIGMVAEHEKGSIYAVLIAAGLTLYMVAFMGVADLWASYRGPVETVRWRADQARSVKRTRDSTVSGPGLIPTLVLRAEAGKCVIQLRAPIGSNGALRRLALRANLGEMERLVAAMGGSKAS
jgi:hypothetical protein